MNDAFSVNFPGTNLLHQTDYVGLVSGKNTDKSQVFETFQGELEHAPIIKNGNSFLKRFSLLPVLDIRVFLNISYLKATKNERF